MIYTIGGIKGGSGKTTIATNLAVILASMKKKEVLLVDADEQETATDFTAWRNKRTDGNSGYTAVQLSGEAIRTEIQKLKKKYDDIIIDTGGRDTASQRAALTVSDIYLIPFIPRSFDVWTASAVEHLIEEIRPVNPKLKIISFLNRADPRGSDNSEAAEYLKESTLNFTEVIIGARKAFANASAKGMGVTELKPKDKKAEEELMALFEECEKILSSKKK